MPSGHFGHRDAQAAKLESNSEKLNPPRRHHYIPQFYLRRWCGSDGLLERYTKPVPGKLDVRRVSTKAVGWWEDLYRAPENDPHRDQYLERGFFRELDDRAARVLEKLNQSPVPELSGPEMSAWAVFLMSLLHRTPEGIAAYKDLGYRLWLETIPELRDQYPELRGANDPPTVEEYEASLTRDDAERSIMRNFATVMVSPTIGNFMMNLNWRVMDIPEGVQDFLLSDDPLARSNGLKKADGHLAIPVSPRRLVVGAYEAQLLDQFVKLKPVELVARMNAWVVEGARHFVVAIDRSQTRFIDNRFGLKQRPGFARI